MGGQAKIAERPCRLCGEMFLPYRDNFTVCKAASCRKALKAERWVKTSSRPSFKEWRSEYAAEYAESGRAKLAQLRSRYGLSHDDLNTIIEAADGRCQCCGRPAEESPLHLDHCHETGVVRGMLCRQCNTGLGQIGDNEEAAARLLSYLTGVADEMETLSTDDPEFQAKTMDLVDEFSAAAEEIQGSFEDIDAEYPSPELGLAISSHCSL